MSWNEVLTAVFGLGIGYFVVSLLMAGKKSTSNRASDRGQLGAAAGPSTWPDETMNPGASPRASSSMQAESMQESSNWFDILGVTPNSTADEIRSAYRQLMSQYHPDKVATLGQELRDLAERKSKEIAAAYAEAMRARGFAE